MLLNASLPYSREKLFHWCFLLALLKVETKQQFLILFFVFQERVAV